jgi:ubiquilin
MEQMVSSPYMQSLLSNPDTLRSLMGANPQMQQLMEQNPELRNLMSDPDFLRQSMDAMRNPAVMREMMRNTDRAMSNLESIPGGSAALHKLYNEVQEPLFEATRGAETSGSVQKVNDANQLKAKYGEMAKPERPISEPMTNPWVTAPVFSSTASSPPSVQSPMDFSAMGQMMQNPGMQQLMSSMFRSKNAGSATTFQDPNFLQQLFNPTSIQAMAGLEQSIAGLQQGNSVPSNGFNSMFGNFLTASQNDPQRKYATQLATLRSMGFTDVNAAINALERSGGDLSRAIDILDAERVDGGTADKK